MNNREAYPPSFSKAYDRILGNFATDVAPQIHKVFSLEAIYEKDRTLLDVCCGPGHLAYYFLNQGFTVTGIDLSEKMLEIARKKQDNRNHKIEWIKADASNFSLDKKFGLVVSTFDSLNLLPDLENLRKCFHCVYNHLISGGIFVFDINTKAGISTNNNVYIKESEDFTIIGKGYFDGISDKGYLKFSGFLKLENGLFEKFEHYSSNTVFMTKDITKILSQLGFNEIKYYIYGKIQMELVNDPESHTKVVVYAKK